MSLCPRTPSVHHVALQRRIFLRRWQGLERSLITEGHIPEGTNLGRRRAVATYDAIVIGAGYCGLTAARDLALSGHQVLLLEARDRIGGRTWTSQDGGEKYEMGDTWIHWQQAFVWREMARYGIEKNLKFTPSEVYPAFAINKTIANGTTYQQTSQENFDMLNSAFGRFCNVDGQMGTTVVALAPQVIEGPLVNREVIECYDKMSCGDRQREVKAAGLLIDEEVRGP